jgi:membrane protein YdbS with pleckstrin-like domain
MSITQRIRTSSTQNNRNFYSIEVWRLSKKFMLFVVFSLVVNHLATKSSFPGSESYSFPTAGFLSSLTLCIFIGIIAELNFRRYKQKYFSKKVDAYAISWYMISTLGYVSILYIPLGILLNKIAGVETELYYLLTGLLLTLLVSFVLLSIAYAQDIYSLYTRSLKDAELRIESGAKTTRLTYENIACFYSQNKTVYTIKNDGSVLSTDFTLNELEEKINDQLFFRANRQLILHKDAINQIEKIENGKLSIRLKPSFEKAATQNIIISRYKREAFLTWFQ